MLTARAGPHPDQSRSVGRNLPVKDGVRKRTVFRIAERHGWNPQRRWRENGVFRGVFRIGGKLDDFRTFRPKTLKKNPDRTLVGSRAATVIPVLSPRRRPPPPWKYIKEFGKSHYGRPHRLAVFCGRGHPCFPLPPSGSSESRTTVVWEVAPGVYFCCEGGGGVVFASSSTLQSPPRFCSSTRS